MSLTLTKSQAHIIASLRFYSSDEGGRKTPTPAHRFGCIFSFEGENFDCFLLVKQTGPIKPGDTVKAPIVFLYPELIKDRLHIGNHFTLRELHPIAAGRVEEIL
jgi:hypothetical protein